MPARRFSVPARPCSHRASRSTLVLLSAISLSPLASPAHGYTLNETGRWTPPYPLGGTQVHMALLPSDGHPYSAKVMWWYGRGHHELFYGGILRWKPGEYNCTYFPGTTLIQPATIPLPPAPARPRPGTTCCSS